MNAISSSRLGAGIHPDIPERVYHADCAIEPSASASILRTIHDQSPLHAWHAHPRLNPAYDAGETTDAQAAGSILHALVLGQPEPFRVIEADDYRTKAAKEARAAALADGLIPILPHKLDELRPAVGALRDRLQAEHPEIFAALNDPETLHEATLIWRERGVMCRCRYDVLPPARYGFSIDLKFTGRSAEPGGFSRSLRDNYLIQADLYPRAVKALRGDAPEFRFVACEVEPPYGVSVHAMAPSLAEVARSRVDRALARWAACLKARHWPGYPPLVHYAEAPGWMLMDEEDRTINDTVAARHAGERFASLYEAAGGPPA